MACPRYSGNPLLIISERKLHVPPNPNKKLKEHLILGITVSGVLIIGLSLIASIVLYRKNKECTVTQSNGEENVVDFNTINECIDSTFMVPNSAKAYAFTLDQMMAATQKFSGNIGKGGFGSVFFGKLPEGKDIAVKVLSLFSTQSVQQFLNEVIAKLLSHFNF